jgi:hypothetical protein
MAQYVAKPFVAGSPNALVLGQTVAAFSSNLHADQIAHILPKYGLDNIDPEKWYPHQSWMNVLKELSQGSNSDSALVAFGKEVVRTAVMPPELDSIPKVLHALHAIHHANLRNIPAEEGYQIEELGERHYLVYHNTPNPDTAIYGFLWGLMARFKHKDEIFVVRQIDNPKPDKKPGSVYEVKWGPQYQPL